MVDREEWVGGGSGSREGEARAHFYPLRVDAHADAPLNVSRCTAGFILCIYSNPRPMPRMKEIRQHHFFSPFCNTLYRRPKHDFFLVNSTIDHGRSDTSPISFPW